MAGFINNIAEMLKDPGTQEIITGIVTQMICFIVFLWILKKAAWGPIINLLDERRNKIASEFKKVEDLEQHFNKLKAEYDRKIAEIENEARLKLQEAVDQGRVYAHEIVESAREEYKQRVQKAVQDIEIEMKNARKEFKEYIINLTLNTTEKLLKEKLDDVKHKTLVANFIADIEKEN